MIPAALLKISILADCATHGFFLLPKWWEYLGVDADCSVKFHSGINGVSDIWLVGLAILDILLRVAGIVAIVGIMAGGIQYMTAGGNPEKAAGARKRIYNTLGGLAIVMLATFVVTFLGNKLGG
jgi:hypothetical protein